MEPFLSGILEKNGGLRPWQEHRSLTIRLSFGGLAFAARWNRKGLRERNCRVFLHEQKTILEDYPCPGCRGIFTPALLELENEDGQVFAQRHKPRPLYRAFRRQLWWDDLDLLYFAGYAAWNYFAMPWLLTWPGVGIQNISERIEGDQTWWELTVEFPPGFATHCPRQVFYFDERGRLRRHDYDPEPFASWARAAHYCFGHIELEGVFFSTYRRVVPRLADRRSLPFPVLVWIKAGEACFHP